VAGATMLTGLLLNNASASSDTPNSPGSPPNVTASAPALQTPPTAAPKPVTRSSGSGCGGGSTAAAGASPASAAAPGPPPPRTRSSGS
jgi:hypothetical protein